MEKCNKIRGLEFKDNLKEYMILYHITFKQCDYDLQAAHAIQLPTAVTFLPSLLNHLFSLLVVTSSEEIGLNVIRVLIHIIHMVHEAGRKEILQAYVKVSILELEPADG